MKTLLARCEALLPITRATQAHCLRAVHATDACLAIPVRGYKQVHERDFPLSVEPGQALVIAGQQDFDIENVPDPDVGEYRAAVLVIPTEVIAAARLLIGEPLGGFNGPRLAVVPITAFATELEDLLEAQAQEEPSALSLRQALLALVLALYARGETGLLALAKPRLADRIGQLIGSDPAHDWNSAHFEAAFNISGATLRRQLAAEATNLRAVLAEARMSHALYLLQSTRQSVKSVAHRTGYQSVSSFVRRFQARYGVEPSRVANA